ncbi:single-stranded-DNA-specific exonuclease RecJ [Salinisphaera aquimarina]|uniref:Single-stranded-DNA-specific exonuclease RecJ n=1 Tax=Salinisphaera aquimarina TaxID=2094031 RepID=A0ABV7ERW9_9GAMM
MTADADGVRPRRIVERALAPTDGLGAIASPLLRRIYAGRGVEHLDQLDYRLGTLPHFRDLKDIDAATGLLVTAIETGRRILVLGDFDADGATSTALVCDALTAMGAAQVDYFIPHRARHGYGLSPRVIDAVGAGQAGDLIVTVDNGIASVAGVEAAHVAGWQVLVCDHHLPGEQLPAAEAIVNPNQPGCGFAGESLAGVGVAFYLMAALRARLAAADPDRLLPKLDGYLDLVALGTVADVVRLDHLNRTLVSQGLRRIRQGRARPGIAALIEVAGREAGRLDTADIGFALAPRLNAAGRLEDMRIGVACLRHPDIEQARVLAGELAAINRRRQVVQQRMQGDAESALAALDERPGERSGLTVFRADWHEGVVGLIAARLREHHHRPVVAFAPGEHGHLKGSARSIPGLHIRDVLAAVDAGRPGLILQFGGHAQAAGLSLAPDAVEEFGACFDAAVAARITPDMITPDLITDGQLQEQELCLDVAQTLRESGPWGAGFDEPLFHGRFVIVSQRIVGEKHLKLSVRPEHGRTEIEAMCFGQGSLLDDRVVHILVYRLAVNVFRDRTTANLIVSHHREAD